MTSKPKLNQPDIEITTTFSDIDIPESLNVNITIPSDMLKDFISQQSIVDFKRDHVELNFREYGKMKIEQDVIIYNDKVFMYTQKLTFDECVKEWNKKGWLVSIHKREIEIRDTKTLTYISIDKKDKAYWCSAYLSFELHYLLTKTLKALEVENEQISKSV